MVLDQGLPGGELHQQQRGESDRGEQAVEPLAVAGEAELNGQAERRPGLPQRHGRERHGLGLRRGLPLPGPGAAPLLGPDAGLHAQDALLELVVAGGGGGGRVGRRLWPGGGVIAGGRAGRRERQRMEAAVPERGGAEGGDGEGAGERRRHGSHGCMRAPALLMFAQIGRAHV